MKRYAVIMATEMYANDGPTDYCHQDAQLLRNTLVQDCDFAEQDILLELLSPDAPKSPQEILEAIKGIVDKSQNGDTILFYYAGHGGYSEEAPFNGEPYLILPETDYSDLPNTGLAFRDVSNLLRNRHRVNIRIFDACASGGDVRGAEPTRDQTAGFINALSLNSEGWVTLAGCGPQEVSHGDSNLRHGVFTYYLCESIKETREGDLILPQILHVSVLDKMEKWSQEQQKVQNPTLNGHMIGKIPFAQRRISKPEQLPVLENRQIPNQANFEQRLSQARSGVIVGSDQHDELVNEYMGHIISYLQTHVETVQSYGCELTISEAKGPYYLPDTFKRIIVNLVEKKQWKPLQKIKKSEHTTGKKHSLSMMLSADYEPPRTTYTYTVESINKFHHTLVELVLAGDGTVPSANFYVYLIPLQTKVCLITAAFMREISDTEDRYISDFSNYLLATLNKEKEFDKINVFLGNALAKFSNAVRDRLQLILEYRNTEEEET